MKDKRNQDIALHIFNKFKSAVYYDEMIMKIIPHEALNKFNIDDLTNQDIEDIKSIIIALDSTLG
jgi:hypothetical protein